MRKIIITVLFINIKLANAQSVDTASYIPYLCTQSVKVFLDSALKYQISGCWEKELFNVSIDPFGNRIKFYRKEQTEIITLGTKTMKYRQEYGEASIINWDHCTDNKNNRCGVRIMFPPDKDFIKSPTYLYIDYLNITYAFQLFIIKR